MFAASKSGRAAGAAPTPTDASFGYVPLLLETGSASSLNTTVTDSSASPNTVTRVNAPSTGWVSPYQTDGYWGNFFNGTNAYLTSTIPALSGQFTIDFWLYRPASGNNYFFTIGDSLGSTGLEVYLGTAGTVFNIYSNNAAQITSSTLPSVAAWNYVAVTRDASNVVRMYLNGTQVGSTWTTSATFATTLRVGVEFYNSTVSGYGNNYISNFRISNNVRTVTSVPTAPFSQDANTLFLSCQSNRFKDNSSNNATVTPTGTPQVNPYFYPSGFTAPAASPGAALFSGTSQYLKSTTATTAFQFGTNPFTIEFWLYQPARPTRQYFCGGLFSGPGFQVVMEPTGLIFSGVTGIGDLPAATIAVPLNAWTHIAVVRTSASASGAAYYINGVPAGTFTISSNISGTASSINVGTSGDSGSEPTNGYIANFRSVKGTAVYTGAFTPPSGPLTQTGGTYPSLTNVVTGFTAANTSLLLNLADSNYTSATNGVQNNTFIDDSNYAFPITRNGTPTQGSITPYWPNGQWSNYFNGSTDYVSAASNAAFTLGSSGNNFTIECWVYANGLQASTATILTTYSNFSTGYLNRWFLGFLTSSPNSTLVWYNSAGNPFTVTSSFPLNSWVHVAVVRNSGTITIYVNGASLFTQTTNQDYTTQGALSAGFVAAGGYFNGYISNLRVVKGTAVYTSAFTPPTTPLTAITNTSLLTCQSNRFRDNSTNSFTITPGGTPRVQAFQPFSPTASYTTALYGGSGIFSSGNYINAASNAAFGMGTGDFTIETWIFATAAFSGYQAIFGDGFTTNSLFFGNTTSGFGLRAGNVADILVTTAPSINQWVHVACTRSGTTVRLFYNGVQQATTTNSTNFVTQTAYIGNDGGGSAFVGYISNLRLVKGTAVYTGAFTPPTLAPLATTGPASAASYSSTTNVNTTFLAPASLLLNMANAGIYDAAVQNNAITVGNAQVSTAQSKWSPSSIFLNGSANYLTMPATPQWAMSGDWTLEAWIYPTTVSGVQIIINTRNLSSVASPIMYLNGSSLVIDTGSAPVISAGTISINSWQYVAATRSGNSWKLFIGGSQVGSTTTNTISYSTAYGCAIGRSAAGENFNGYIQDVRVTKAARTITASPTAPFPTR